MTCADFSRTLLINVVHCSANLTKLINAERMKRVRSASGADKSRELKSIMRAEVAKRVLFTFMSTKT